MLKISMGVDIVGAVVPFSAAFGVALLFGLSKSGAVYVRLTMTSTAVVVTLEILRDLGPHRTRTARVVVAARPSRGRRAPPRLP